jgi:tight adherence protein C
MSLPLDLIIEALIFCIIVGMTIAVAREVERSLEQRRRLGEGNFAGVPSATPLLQGRGLDNRLYQWVESSTSISDSAGRQKLRAELSLAGFDSLAAPVLYVITRFLLAIGLPLAFLLIRILSSEPIAGLGFIFGTLILCGLGFIAPSAFVSSRARARRTDLEIEFPDALDLMVVCVEAGLSLDATFVRVGEEVRESHPRIAREFARVSEELRAGRSRADALRAMADRADAPGIRSFVALVIQTESLGASVAQTLRTYSAEMRETRFLRAEERAMRIPVLMTVPLVTCILPVIVGALLLPAIIDVVRTLIPALTAHHGGG